MSKSTKIAILLLALVVAGSCAFLLLRPTHVDRPVARITLDGEVMEEIDLTAVAESYTFIVDGPAGFSNTVQVLPGQIRVKEAGCPDQVCVNQGYIHDSTAPIVCLPNKLVIEIIGGGDGLDAATG